MIKNKSKGFTLIEILVSVVSLSLVVVTGTLVFFRSLRDSSKNELRKVLDERNRSMSLVLDRYLREATIVNVDGDQDRAVCLASGGMVVGDTIQTLALDGLSTQFSLSGNVFSSTSATVVSVNDSSVLFSKVSLSTPIFTWFCTSGVPDRLQMNFRLTAVGTEGDTDIHNDYTIDLNLPNSTGQ